MKEKKILKILFILLMTIILIPLKSNANTQTSVDVATTEEFIEAANNSDVVNINIISNDIDLILKNAPKVLNVTGKTINLNNHTIKTDNMAVVFEGNNFTIKNGIFDAKGQSYSMFIGDEGGTNNAIIENITGIGGFNIYNSNNVVIRNCNVTGKKYYTIWCDQGGQAIVESGTFQAEGTAVFGLSASIYDTKLEIKGGTYLTNGKPLVLQGKDGNGDEWGKPEISGGNFDVPLDAEYCKDGFELILTEGNKYIVCNHVSTSIRNQKDATCTEDGYTGDSYCTKCGKKIKTGTTIGAIGHTPSEWKSDGQYHWKECTLEKCKAIIQGTKQAHIEKDGKCEVCLYEMSETEMNSQESSTNMDIDKKHQLENEPKTGVNNLTIIMASLLSVASIGYVVCKKKIYK